jgi:predicted membrane protein
MELINLCAIGLAVSFFLPWVRLVLGAGPSGFDLQKMGDMHLLLWLIPILSALTIFAGITKRSQQVVAQIAGALPFCVGVYWYFKLGSSLFQIMTYGAYLSLFFGAALFVLARNEKRT